MNLCNNQDGWGWDHRLVVNILHGGMIGGCVILIEHK